MVFRYLFSTHPTPPREGFIALPQSDPTDPTKYEKNVLAAFALHPLTRSELDGAVAPEKFHRFLLRWALLAIGIFVGTILFICQLLPSVADDPVVRSTYTPVTPNIGLSHQLAQTFGQYSPWYPAEAYVPPPSGCHVDQVNIVSANMKNRCASQCADFMLKIERHGARYPTTRDSAAIKPVYERFRSFATHKNPALNFIHKWKWSLGTESLVPFGAAQCVPALERWSELHANPGLKVVRRWAAGV